MESVFVPSTAASVHSIHCVALGLFSCSHPLYIWRFAKMLAFILAKNKSIVGLAPLRWFFLDFGEAVRQAGSREDPLNARGCTCQTPVPSYPRQAGSSSSAFVPLKPPSPLSQGPHRMYLVVLCAGSDPAGYIPATQGRSPDRK